MLVEEEAGVMDFSSIQKRRYMIDMKALVMCKSCRNSGNTCLNKRGLQGDEEAMGVFLCSEYLMPFLKKLYKSPFLEKAGWCS